MSLTPFGLLLTHREVMRTGRKPNSKRKVLRFVSSYPFGLLLLLIHPHKAFCHVGLQVPRQVQNSFVFWSQCSWQAREREWCKTIGLHLAASYKSLGRRYALWHHHDEWDIKTPGKKGRRSHSWRLTYFWSNPMYTLQITQNSDSSNPLSLYYS